MNSYKEALFDDLMDYGFCVEEVFKPNIFQRIIRRIKGLPLNRRIIDPMKLTDI